MLIQFKSSAQKMSLSVSELTKSSLTANKTHKTQNGQNHQRLVSAFQM